VEDAVVVFFFANSNHLSNVKTLQSIYAQDYPKINLCICNDCTYGFQSERLLNNFLEKKEKNIQQVYYHENPYPLGEYRSQAQLWDHMDASYMVTLHSGEVFTSASSLREGIAGLLFDRSLSALVLDCELWSEGFAQKQAVNTIAGNTGRRTELSRKSIPALQKASLRDCMVIYRLSALRGRSFPVEENAVHASNQILPALLEAELKVAASPVSMCRYTISAVTDVSQSIPATFGDAALQNVAQLLQTRGKTDPQEPVLFGETATDASAVPKKNLHVTLYKLSTFVKIKGYALVCLLLFIAAALFLAVEKPLLTVLGIGLLVIAIAVSAWTGFVIFCNLYYKKNPQRLVM